MRSAAVVEVEVAADRGAGLRHAVAGVQKHLLVTLRHNRSATVLFSFLTLEATQLELLNEIAPRKTVIDDLLTPID